MGIGTFNAIGSDVILDDRDARKGWADDVAKYTYHVGGAPITLIPGVGDAAQRVLDSATYEWSKDVKAEADQAAGDATRQGTARCVGWFGGAVLAGGALWCEQRVVHGGAARPGRRTRAARSPTGDMVTEGVRRARSAERHGCSVPALRTDRS
ncbi:hypothetical protein [Streptomyces sp. NPDC001816]|uniref:hypothetical protein n=1 Tax=Streptomyces sp. NPDC001816 TaxID=3364612 RepID=UPI003699D38D